MSNDQLREAVVQAIRELDLEHRPLWFSDDAKAAGKVPIGCGVCWPHDGHWPCTTHMIADDLRRVLEAERKERG